MTTRARDCISCDALPLALDKSEGVVKDKNVLSGVCDTACSPEKVEDQDSGISR